MPRNILPLAAACASLIVFAPKTQAQNLGAYYSNMYFQNHMAMNLLRRYGGGGGGGGHTRRVRRMVHASPVYKISPARSAVIDRMAAAVPAANRSVARAELLQLRQAYPALMAAAGKSVGLPLRPNDIRDAATVAGVLAYQELTGKELTNAQFAAERKATFRWDASHSLTSSQVQESGEIYEMAICMMAGLKAYESNPKNNNPQLTRQQLHQLAQNTFQAGYKDADYTKFAPTSKGIVKVGK